MAIPEGRLSTNWAATQGAYTVPEERKFYAFRNFERGPLAIEDTSMGVAYQNWTFEWDPGTGDITATPETSGTPSVILNVPQLDLLSVTFDQNARIQVAYVTATSSYLYWYDTQVAQTVTTDLGADIVSVSLYLDDKRYTQSASNDMLLWYTKSDGNGTYTLYMLRQRDRFTIENEMATLLETPYIQNSGMNSYLRGQLTLTSYAPFNL